MCAFVSIQYHHVTDGQICDNNIALHMPTHDNKCLYLVVLKVPDEDHC